ncbi:hypothetical protein [Ramlibacter sp. PS4R-6]|uniref:hypothetical protein n=1 Tax=Ramlibacter sp. PS4R-6 TaxID=3133438 RepID=UPI0030B27DB5
MDPMTAGAPCAGPCTLLVTLVGFDPAPARRLAALLDDCSALGARWRVGGPGTSDLWIVDGEKARGLGHGLVEVGGAHPVQLRPADMPHPVAFTEPLHESISTGHHFDPASMNGLNVLLTQLARWLSPRLVQQALVAHLIANGASFTRSNVIEVRQGQRLLALVDFAGDTAVAADATPADLRGADWVLRERGAAFAPPGFRSASTEQVLWHFANRSDAPPPLPGRYTRLPIHLRRVPALPVRELSDRQLQLVRELAYGPHTFVELAQRTGAGPSALRRDLAALYLVGAITCDPGRSRATRDRRRTASFTQEELSFIGARPSTLDELTAPGFARPTVSA